MKLKISDDLSLPADAVTSTLVVYGGKGMGKTNFGSVLVEELSANGLRWAWLDPLGVSWGLRHSKDGRGPGIECLILGGTHGDVPIEPDGGSAVADVVVDEHVNVLIDFSRKPSGEMWGVGEKIRFVTAYTRRLFQRQGDLIGGRRREPLFQVLDEAARYVPQTIPASNPDLSKCVSAWQQLVEEGRNIGLGVGLISQRSARMNKDVSELADAMFAFRTIGPNSLGAVLDWLGEHVERSRIKELSEKVRTLPVGRALIVSPGWLKFETVATIRPRHTFDSSATPKPGEQSRAVKGEGAKPDLDKIRSRMAETIERAKADDPKELRKTIADLQQKLKAQPAIQTVVDEAAVHGAAQIAIAERDKQWDASLREYDANHLQPIRDLLFEIFSKTSGAGICDAFAFKPDEPLPVSCQSIMEWPPDHPRANTAGYIPRKRVRFEPDTKEIRKNGCSLARGPHRVLTAIAQHGNEGVTEEQIAVLTGYKSTSRYEFLRQLSGMDLIDKGPPIRVTQAGLKTLGDGFERLPTGRALIEHWNGRLSGGEQAIFAALVKVYPRALSNADLELAANCKSTSRYEFVRKLKARKLVEQSHGGYKAADHLFR